MDDVSINEPSVLLGVAVDAPVQGVFDYLAPESLQDPTALIGCRVRVPFGASERVGVVVRAAQPVGSQAEAQTAYKPVVALLDDAPLLSAVDLRLGAWLAGYYHAPLGEVLALMLPAGLRDGAPLRSTLHMGWRLTACAPIEGVRAAKQAQVLALLRAAPQGLADTALRGFSTVLRTLQAKGWVERAEVESANVSPPVSLAHELNAEQQAAHAQIAAKMGQFAVFLLHGVTGSGKTEVYLAAVADAVQRGEQVLVLLPEIALTPQWVARFSARFAALGADALVVLHSAMTETARTLAWQAAQCGRAKVVLGTRSAVLTPMPRLGLVVVDEEHDSSYKQQEGWRYHARDVALVRAQQCGVPVVLGSATPSLESLHHAQQGRYTLLRLTQRAGGARLPRLALVDVRRRAMREGLSEPLIERMRAHLVAGGQVLLFLNRRGYAPALACHACGHVAECAHCSAPMTVHRQRGRLVCHHCGAERALPKRCPACGAAELIMPGQGTERLELALQGLFPEFALERIDRDSTRRKGSLQHKLDRAQSGAAHILLGTQMLAKGHDFPGVTLAAIIDADSGLMSSDFRAAERMVQLIVQVAGRAGRADRPGEVMIQTHQPEHVLLQAMLQGGFDACVPILLQQRRAARLPPFAFVALLRAEARDAHKAQDFSQRAAQFLCDSTAVQVWGPAPAPLERRAGRFRLQLMLVAAKRAPLHRALEQWMAVQQDWAERRGVRWSLDIDPQDMG